MTETQKMMGYAQAQKTARLALLGKHAIFGSWRKVSDNISGTPKLNRGLLCAIANGKRKAPDVVLARLGITYVHTGAGRVCPEHGVVHDRVHHVKPAWLAQAVAGLRALETARNGRR